ncbi:MAG: hypothetical protein NTV01_06840 [Bacteroidia bacterium]|nr:hypothetical protein [Bacteroidia bacterium]
MDSERKNVMPRILKEQFMSDLKNGALKDVLQRVKADHTLDLQIRDDQVNIYYRGGNLCRISRDRVKYQFEFDEKYAKETCPQSLKDLIPGSKDTPQVWIARFPQLKQIVDIYLSSKHKGEREYQQLIVRENNYSKVSNATDYFIVDIEYDDQTNGNRARFDILAIKWESDGQLRKEKGLLAMPPRLVLMEVKYGDGALKGQSGIKKHIKDLDNFLSNPTKVNELKQEVIYNFKQKRELGLVKFGGHGNKNQVINISNEKPEVILLLAAHDPASSILRNELKNVDGGMQHADLMVAMANFVGYALFREHVLPFKIFLQNYQNQIGIGNGEWEK